MEETTKHVNFKRLHLRALLASALLSLGALAGCADLLPPSSDVRAAEIAVANVEFYVMESLECLESVAPAQATDPAIEPCFESVLDADAASRSDPRIRDGSHIVRLEGAADGTIRVMTVATGQWDGNADSASSKRVTCWKTPVAGPVAPVGDVCDTGLLSKVNNVSVASDFSVFDIDAPAEGD